MGLMATAFVLINVETGREREVYDSLMEIDEVIEVYPLFGEYDLITKVETKWFDDLSEVVVEKVRGIVGVTDTETLTSTQF